MQKRHLRIQPPPMAKQLPLPTMLRMERRRTRRTTNRRPRLETRWRNQKMAAHALRDEARGDEEQDENVPMTSAERRAARHRNVHDPDHSSTRDERDEGAASGDDAAEEGGATDEADSKPSRASSVQIPERGDVRLRLDSEVISAAKHASDADGGIVDIEKLKSA